MRVWLQRGKRFWFLAFAAYWLLFVFLPSFPAVRSVLAYPLVVSDSFAHGQVAYVLAGGTSFQERLAAASDLYHMGRIERIFIFTNHERGQYNFIEQASWTPTQWAIHFLEYRGVTRDAVVTIEQEPKGWFGTLAESKLVRDALPEDVKRLVIVTSAAHTRRSLLSFRRTLGDKIEVTSFAATEFKHSQEMYLPLWIEYFKFFIYFMVA